MTMTVMQAANTAYGGTYTQAVGGGAGNYVVFRGLTATTFTLTATPGTATGARRAPINGLQLVSAP